MLGLIWFPALRKGDFHSRCGGRADQFIKRHSSLEARGELEARAHAFGQPTDVDRCVGAHFDHLSETDGSAELSPSVNEVQLLQNMSGMTIRCPEGVAANRLLGWDRAVHLDDARFQLAKFPELVLTCRPEVRLENDARRVPRQQPQKVHRGSSEPS